MCSAPIYQVPAPSLAAIHSDCRENSTAEQFGDYQRVHGRLTFRNLSNRPLAARSPNGPGKLGASAEERSLTNRNELIITQLKARAQN